jgi:hypothetical protein
VLLTPNQKACQTRMITCANFQTRMESMISRFEEFLQDRYRRSESLHRHMWRWCKKTGPKCF